MPWTQKCGSKYNYIEPNFNIFTLQQQTCNILIQFFPCEVVHNYKHETVFLKVWYP